MQSLPDAATLAEYEKLAAELARLGGAEVQSALGRALTVGYKGAAGTFSDPVSDVDNAVEVLLRARIGELYPEHDIIGEEIDERPGRQHSHVWAVDPIDGTANFVNGLPLFASSVGLLIDGRPAAGAIWCSVSHALRAGVYSAHSGGPVRFDGVTIERPDSPGVRARLVGLPRAGDLEHPQFQSRKTGSAAIECAFVAAGLLVGARFDTPNLWDVAGGTALVLASGGDVLCRQGQHWSPLADFMSGAPGGDLARWTSPLIIGRPEATAFLSEFDR